MYHTFFYSYFAFCGQRKQATTKFCMFLNLDMVPKNSTLGGFAYICGQSKLLRLKERKFTACSR